MNELTAISAKDALSLAMKSLQFKGVFNSLQRQGAVWGSVVHVTEPIFMRLNHLHTTSFYAVTIQDQHSKKNQAIINSLAQPSNYLRTRGVKHGDYITFKPANPVNSYHTQIRQIAHLPNASALAVLIPVEYTQDSTQNKIYAGQLSFTHWTRASDHCVVKITNPSGSSAEFTRKDGLFLEASDRDLVLLNATRNCVQSIFCLT